MKISDPLIQEREGPEIIMDQQEIRTISGQIQTPAYVFSGAEFAGRAQKTKAVLGADIDICYSMKANPFLLEVLPDVFSAVEVCSPGELEICIRRKIPAEKIIYSGLNKGAGDVRRALEYGVGLITAESRHHIELINSISADMGIMSKVLVRISAGSQFGIDREEAAELLRSHSSFKAISFEGLHFFTGTQKRKVREIAKELHFLEEYLQKVRESSGLALGMVEYGTGLPAYMFHDKDIDSLDEAVDRELAMLEEAAPYLQSLAEISHLTVEMGRFFAASCGHYFTQVADTKRNDGVNYAVVDGGSHQLRYFGQMQGMQIPFIDHLRINETGEDESRTGADAETEAADESWTICGSLCTTADVLSRNTELPGLRTGDILVFHQTGAYSIYESMSLFLSRDLPRIYIHDGGLRLCRDRIESLELNTSL